jgi:hypothetical protein
VVPANIHDFFLASAGVAGALIGLLFVAISVTEERLTQAAASVQVQRIRANGALVSFTNALTVSLFALIPGDQVGMTALVVSLLGLLFVAGSLLSLIRLRMVHSSRVRDAVFPAGLVFIFGFQLKSAADLLGQPGDHSAVQTIAYLVAVCFLVGIARAWELIGGPSIGFGHELAALVRGEGDSTAAEPADGVGSREDSAPGQDSGARQESAPRQDSGAREDDGARDGAPPARGLGAGGSSASGE